MRSITRLLGTSAAGRPTGEVTVAGRLLGTDHPLTRALQASQTAIEQLLTLTVVDASAAGLISAGAAIGAPLLVVSLLLQSGIAFWLMLIRQEIDDESRALIITGSARTLASVERERRRLLDPRTREHLARSLEDLVREARAAATPDAALALHRRPLLRLEPELREIVALLKAGTADAAGVARIERLLSGEGSPLYGVDDDLLREELARIRSVSSRASPPARP